MGMGWVSGEAHGDALIPTYSAHDAILSQSHDELMIWAQPHFERIATWKSLQHTMY